MSDVPRDGYTLSDHAVNQAKDRKIGIDVVGKVIEEGQIKEADKPHQRQFVAPIGNCRHPVSVVVDPTDKVVITVQFYKQWLQ